MAFAEGREEGGSIKELYRRGFVEPAGKIDRRIRWKLVENKLSRQEIVKMLELTGEDFSEFKIIDWSNGFQMVPGQLYTIASFIAKKGGFAAGFAFRLSYLDMVSREIDTQALIKKARDIIKTCMDSGRVSNLDELTFEFQDPDDFVEVKNPTWWKKST